MYCSELTFQVATATLNPDGTLTVSASGVVDESGTQIPATVTYSSFTRTQ